MRSDFEIFTERTPWFFNDINKIEELGLTQLELREDFIQTFSNLAELVSKARVTKILLDEEEYLFFAWTTSEDETFGWLTKKEKEEVITLELLDEHKLLLNTIGGICDVLNDPAESFSNNQTFLFLGSQCTLGLNYWKDSYLETCNEESKKPIDHSQFVTFVEEASGALTMYNKETKEVVLFSPDNCFENVRVIEGQPEYTFYEFTNATTFIDYVEELANQWLNEIK